MPSNVGIHLSSAVANNINASINQWNLTGKYIQYVIYCF